MFKYKSQAEIDKMDDTQAEAYAVAKREFEQKEYDDKLTAAIEKTKTELTEQFKGDVEAAKGAVAEMQQTILELKETADGKEAIKKGIFVEFVEKNVKNYTDSPENKQYGASLVIKAAALMTTANVLPNVAGGFSPLFGNYIDTEIGHVPKPENIILPLVTVKTQPGTESIWFSDRINEDGDAAFIAEGALKPLADADWQTTKKDIQEVAVRWKFTKRLMMHAPAIVQDFEEHVRELVDQKIDDQLLEGDGTGNNLDGLELLAATFVVPTGLAGYYTAPNIYDVIMAMATRVRLSNFKGKLTVILNTVWMAKMAGIKDAEQRYIIAPFVAPDGTRVGAVEVKFSNKIAEDDILLGDLKKFNVVWAEQVMYDEGYENDDFSKNLVSKKLEAFLGTYIKTSDAGSILYGDISDIQDDLAAA
jgi:hypothetical protein